MGSLWAAALLLRRLRTERGIVLLIVALVAATSCVFAAAPRLFNRVSDDALRHAVQVASAAQRDVVLAVDSTLAPGSGGGVSGVRAEGERFAAAFPPSLAALISDHDLRVTTVRLYVTNAPSYETHVSLRYQDGLTDATRLTSGRWPVDRGVPLLEPSGGSDVGPVVLEAAFSAGIAAEIGVKVGDRLAVTLDLSDALVRGTRYAIPPAEIEVVGLYEPLDPDAEEWRGDQDLLQVSQHGTDDEPVAYATAYVPAEMYPSLWASGLPFHNQWRFRIDPGRLDAGNLAELQFDLHRLGVIAGAVTRGPPEPVVLTSLPAILDRYAVERALSESVLSIAAIGPFGLASGAMAMVAILLVRRRRATLALARGRGASSALVLGTQLWESILLAGGASLVGLLAAISAVDARSSPLSALLSIAVAVAATLLLVGASWSAAMRPLGNVERDDVPVLRVAPRRLVIEMTIVFVAVAATLLLRQRGLTVGAPGGVVRIDPLLASVPVLSGLAAGIVAMRLYPLPIRALGWLAARRRDVVPVLGLRMIGRQSAAANLPLLVMLLTAAFGAFSSVIASSLDRGQVIASYLEVSADYRVEEVGLGVLGEALHLDQIPGVEAVASGIVDSSATFTGTRNQRATIYLQAMEPLGFESVVAGTPLDPRWPSAFLAEPAGSGLGTEENPIPAILSVKLPPGTFNLDPGDTFLMTVVGESLTFRFVEQRADFPGIPDRPFVVVPWNWVRAAGDRLLLPSVAWLRASREARAGLAATIAAARESVHVVSRFEAYDVLHDAALAAVIPAGYTLALAVAAVYMALTIIGALILATARRTRDLAFLRTLGVTPVQALALTVMEHAPPVLIAVVPGVALGIAVAVLCQPGLGLATFVGASEVPLFVEWPALLLMAGALIGVVAAAVAAGTWLARRARLVDALRIGDD